MSMKNTHLFVCLSRTVLNHHDNTYDLTDKPWAVIIRYVSLSRSAQQSIYLQNLVAHSQTRYQLIISSIRRLSSIHFFRNQLFCTSVIPDRRVCFSQQSLRCAIEGGKALKLVLTGSCIPQTPLKEVKYPSLLWKRNYFYYRSEE